jgi:hypothetical protein
VITDCAPHVCVVNLQGSQSSRAGPFAVINGAVARDALVVSVPEGAQVEPTLYVLYLSTGMWSAVHVGAVELH